MSEPLLVIDNLAAQGRLRAFSACVMTGELIHIIGPNGAGKSTLLARLAGMMPGEGEAYLDGAALSTLTPPALARRRAYLPQQYAPGAWMPVFQYLALHRPAACSAAELDDGVAFLCQTLMLVDKLSRPLSQLSGGEWQRVRIAAVCLQVWPALNAQARLLLLDEPMNSLDIAQQAAVDRLVAYLLAHGVSVIASAHDVNHTLHHAQRVWMLKNGAMTGVGNTAEMMTPDNLSRLFELPFKRINHQERPWLLYG